MNPTTQDPPANAVSPDTLAPRLRRRLLERVKEIAADPNAQAKSQSLRAELADDEQEIADAERQLGVATLEGKSLQHATKKLDAARSHARRVEIALAELERRREEAHDKAWDAAVAEERVRGYQWFMEYLECVAAYLRAQAAADEAAERLRNIDELASITNFQTGLWGMPSETLYDEELLGATSPRPLSRMEERRRLGESPFARLSLESCERLRNKAESLAADEGRRETT